jgi:hypothetical protein
MDCNNFCKEEINKILQNNEKMKEIVNKGKNRRYTEKERNEYNELFDEGVKLDLERQMCMDGCEERKRRHQNAIERRTGGGRRSLSHKVIPNIKRRRVTRRNIRRSTRDRK